MYENDYERLPTLPPTFEVDFAARYASLFADARQAVFGGVPLSASLEQVLDEALQLRFSQAYFEDDESGIVIAGFGENELFPGLRSYRVEFVAADHLRYRQGNPYNITFDRTVHVLPFAQQSEVWSFLFGSHPDFDHDLSDAVDKLLQDHAGELIDQIPKLGVRARRTLTAAADGLRRKRLTDFNESMMDTRIRRYVTPIFNAVTTLPKEDLATFAEALVSLSSLRQQTSMRQQTVGGPVDVAIITKGDGFVWIRRKNYIDIALNPHFSANYKL